MEKFKKSLRMFKEIEGENYSPILWEIKKNDFLLQCRSRIKDGQPFIFQFWTDGNGYQVYKPEHLND